MERPGNECLILPLWTSRLALDESLTFPKFFIWDPHKTSMSAALDFPDDQILNFSPWPTELQSPRGSPRMWISHMFPQVILMFTPGW